MVLWIVGLSGAALAQGWGEQAPLQFRYSNQGISNEVYRNQLGMTAAAAAASSSSGLSGGGGLGQSSSQLNNAIELNGNNTYNVTVTGDNNYLNVSGSSVNAQQTSTGTTQSSSNSTSGSPTVVKQSGSSP
ncbi:MAG: hypothetical protein ACREB8_02295 [Pseudolabrys sp.]